MKPALALTTISTLTVLLGSPPARALDPSLDVSQYAPTAWTVRDGFSLGNIYAMAQTPAGYLWLGTEFGLFRFDGIHSVPWQPPAGQQLPDRNINALLVTRDGTLWVGTFGGLVTWSGGKMTRRPELGTQFVSSLFEDREGTVWAGSLAPPTGRLCAIRGGSFQYYGDDGAFGRAVWALYEDSSGNLWAGAQSGLWRLKPGPPRRHVTPTEIVGLSNADDGRLLIALHGAGLMQLAADKVQSYPVRGAVNSTRRLRDRDVDSNRVLRDHDGGLWIGTVERGLIHLHNGRTDVFTKADGLSGDVVLSVFEDREGNAPSREDSTAFVNCPSLPFL
jgi:ligand-binding sensor domain-containing protein